MIDNITMSEINDEELCFMLQQKMLAISPKKASTYLPFQNKLELEEEKLFEQDEEYLLKDILTASVANKELCFMRGFFET